VLAASVAPCAHGQADGCRGALDALNRVKEQITPRIDATTPEGRDRLRTMESSLVKGSRACREFPELWFYLRVVALRLSAERPYQQDFEYANRKLKEFVDDGKWDPAAEFDPFTMPPASHVSSPPQDLGVASAPGKAQGRKWALVVGIDRFSDPRAERLKFASKDAHDFASFLVDPQGGAFDPKHVSVLTNEDATLHAIREQMGRIRVIAGPDDMVVIYVASHGSPREVDPNGVSYILTYDSDLDNPATLYSGSLQMIDLVQQVNREFRAHNVVLILDTCYSGAALTGSEDTERSGGAPFSQAFDNLMLANGRAVLTSSRSNERSWEIGDEKIGGNGYFAHFLLQVLRETQGKDMLSHVFSSVSARVASRVRADLNVTQNPTYEFSDGASAIVLGAPE